MLFAGNYLIVITKKTKIGEFFNHVIWKATDFDILSYKKTMLHLTDIQVRTELLTDCRPEAVWAGEAEQRILWISVKPDDFRSTESEVSLLTFIRSHKTYF